MATVAGVAIFDSTSNAITYTTASLTPAVGDLAVVFVGITDETNTNWIISDSLGGTWTKIRREQKGNGADIYECWVRDTRFTATTTYTVTMSHASGQASGCSMRVFQITGITRSGIDAIRSQGGQTQQSANTTPAPVMDNAALTANPVITANLNQSNSNGTAIPAGSTGYGNGGYGVPTTGHRGAFFNSGFTSATVTWGGNSATVFASLAIEIEISATPISHTADAVLKAVLTIGHTADAVLQKAQTVAHSADAVLQKAITTSHTADAVLVAAKTTTHTADAVLQKAQTTTHTADAVLQTTVIATHTAGAVLQKAQTTTHTADALLQAAPTTTHTADAVLQKAQTVAHSADAVLQTTQAAAHTADAILQQTLQTPHSADAVLQATRTVSHTADAVLRILVSTTTAAVDLDASYNPTVGKEASYRPLEYRDASYVSRVHLDAQGVL